MLNWGGLKAGLSPSFSGPCRLRRYAPKAELMAGDRTYTAEMEALLVSNGCACPTLVTRAHVWVSQLAAPFAARTAMCLRVMRRHALVSLHPNHFP